MLSFMAAARCYVPDATLATHWQQSCDAFLGKLTYDTQSSSNPEQSHPRAQNPLGTSKTPFLPPKAQIFLTKQANTNIQNPSPPAVRCFRRSFLQSRQQRRRSSAAITRPGAGGVSWRRRETGGGSGIRLKRGPSAKAAEPEGPSATKGKSIIPSASGATKT